MDRHDGPLTPAEQEELERLREKERQAKANARTAEAERRERETQAKAAWQERQAQLQEQIQAAEREREQQARLRRELKRRRRGERLEQGPTWRRVVARACVKTVRFLWLSACFAAPGLIVTGLIRIIVDPCFFRAFPPDYCTPARQNPSPLGLQMIGVGVGLLIVVLYIAAVRRSRR